MTRMSPLDACAVQEDVDIMTVFKYLFHEQADVALGGEISCVYRDFAAEGFELGWWCLSFSIL